MQILSLLPYEPYPPDSGGRLRSHYLLRALAARHRVTVASLSFDPWRAEYMSSGQYACLGEPTILIPGLPRIELSRAGRALRSLAPRPLLGSPAWIREHDLPQFWNRLATMPLEQFDAIHVRNMHLAPYALAIAKRYPAMKLILDLDDIGSLALLRRIQTSKIRLLSRWRVQLYRDYMRLRLYEKAYLKRFDSVWVCSAIDVERVTGWTGAERVDLVPNVIDVDALEPYRSSPSGHPKILFSGTLDNPANVSALEFFCRSVWPLVHGEIADAELLIVGRDPSPSVRRLHSLEQRINVVGTVPDMGPYWVGSTVMVVPLLFGTGTRLKILEALAVKLPVVSSSIGAEGLRVTNGTDILIADGPVQFAKVCLSLLRDPEQRAALAERGLQLVRENYSLPALQAHVDAVCDRVLGGA